MTAPRLPIVAFTDLDDTLFSSLRKQRDSGELEPVAYLSDGAPISHTDARQRALLGWLAHCDLVIPVTARSAAAFARVRLPFSSWAVLSHGATVLQPGGAIDRNWQAALSAPLDAARPLLREALEAIERCAANADGSLRAQLVTDDGRPLYLMTKHRMGDAAVVARVCDDVIRPWLAAHPGFTLHVNDNNLAVLPPGIGKAPAVAHVQARLRATIGPYLSIGLGDSSTDASFMLACDYALLPTQSQLSQRLRDGGEVADAGHARLPAVDEIG